MKRNSITMDATYSQHAKNQYKCPTTACQYLPPKREHFWKSLPQTFQNAVNTACILQITVDRGGGIGSQYLLPPSKRIITHSALDVLEGLEQLPATRSSRTADILVQKFLIKRLTSNGTDWHQCRGRSDCDHLVKC